MRSALSLAALAVLPAMAQWTQLESPMPPRPTPPMAVTTTARIGEVMSAGTVTARGDFSKNTWEVGIAPLSLQRLVPSPDAPETVYGIATDTKQPLWRTVNGGRTWHELKTAGVIPSLRELSVGPFEGGELYAMGANGELYSSADGGLHWRRHGAAADPRNLACDHRDALSDFVAPKLLAHPNIKGLVFAFVPCGLARSRDAGNTWQLVLRNGSGPIVSLADGTLYAFEVRPTSRRLFASRDLGDTWEDRGVGFSSIAADRFARDTLWRVDWQLGLARSTDGGRSWSSALAAIGEVDLLFPAPGEYVAVDRFSRHVHRWEGNQWKLVTPPGTANEAPVGFAVRDDGGMLLSGPARGNRGSITDLFAKPPGSGWINRGSNVIGAVTFARHYPSDTVYAAVEVHDRFFPVAVTLVRVDSQGNLEELAEIQRGVCKMLAMSPRAAIEALVMCGLHPLAPFPHPVSVFGIWTPRVRIESAPGPALQDVRAAAWGSDGVITAAQRGVVYRGGQVILRLDESDLPTSLAVHPTDPNRLYLATTSGIRESVDGGRTWAPFELGTVLPSALLSAARDGLYAASSAGVFRCGDYRCAGPGNPERADLIELERPNRNHYFLSADADEVASLEAAGWTRTGEKIAAYKHQVAGAAPLRRFYGLPEAGLDTHFFTPDNSYESTLLREGSAWLEERSGESFVYPEADQNCAIGAKVWRVVNIAGGRVNHRYTAKASIRNEMIMRGWHDEGIRFCAVE